MNMSIRNLRSSRLRCGLAALHFKERLFGPAPRLSLRSELEVGSKLPWRRLQLQLQLMLFARASLHLSCPNPKPSGLRIPNSSSGLTAVLVSVISAKPFSGQRQDVGLRSISNLSCSWHSVDD